jgi:hypothetical protein
MKEDTYETAEDLIESWEKAYSQQENGATLACRRSRSSICPIGTVSRYRCVSGRCATGFPLVRHR